MSGVTIDDARRLVGRTSDRADPADPADGVGDPGRRQAAPRARPRGHRDRARSRDRSSSTGSTSWPTDDPMVLRIEVECSAGTYIRSLAADLGHAARRGRASARAAAHAGRFVHDRRGRRARRLRAAPGRRRGAVTRPGRRRRRDRGARSPTAGCCRAGTAPGRGRCSATSGRRCSPSTSRSPMRRARSRSQPWCCPSLTRRSGTERAGRRASQMAAPMMRLSSLHGCRP